MRTDEIESLLERYYEGVSTREEEQVLAQFFAGDEVPCHLRADRELFRRLHATAPELPPPGMGKRLEELIDRWDADERRTLPVGHRRHTVRLRWIARVAAGVLLLLGTAAYLHRPVAHTPLRDTCATPEEAYVQAQRAIGLLALGLNKGMAELEKVDRTASQVQENIQQQFNRINHKP